MDKTVAGLIAAVSALAAAGAAHATAAPQAELARAMQVNSYADLLKPIPNALSVQAAFAQAQEAGGAVPEVMTVQFHHHHHHRYYRRRYYHHHHHHHHHHRRGIGVFIR